MLVEGTRSVNRLLGRQPFDLHMLGKTLHHNHGIAVTVRGCMEWSRSKKEGSDASAEDANQAAVRHACNTADRTSQVARQLNIYSMVPEALFRTW